MRRLRARAIDFSIDLPHVLSPGSVAVVATMEVEHDTYMTQAWASDPLAWLLARVQAQGLSRRDDLTDR
jgi:hypothetical protein